MKNLSIKNNFARILYSRSGNCQRFHEVFGIIQLRLILNMAPNLYFRYRSVKAEKISILFSLDIK